MFLKNITNVSYVGIGLVNPAYPLDVAGDVRWSGTLQGGTVPWARLTGYNLDVIWTGLLGWGNLTGYNLNVNWAGKLGWGNLTAYPAACPAGQAVIAIGDILTCAAVSGISPWDNSTTQIFVRAGYPLFVNISNALFINGSSPSIQLQPTSLTPLQLNGTIYYDAALNKFRCYQNGIWTDCITSVTEPGAGFWTLTGSSLYPNQTNWNVGIGTNVPSEKLEVQGRVLVASSNPFELEPSDNVLDVKGSINATGNLYVGGNNIYGSGGALRISLGDTTNLYASLLSLSGNLKIGGNVIQDSAGTNRITLSSGFVEFNDNIKVGGNNIQNSTGTNRISFYPGYILFNDNVRIGGNVIQNSTGVNRITFSPGVIEFNDNIKVGGNVIQDSGGTSRISLGDITTLNSNLVLSAGNWVNATNFNASNLICLGGICKNAWPSSSLAGGSGASGQVAFWISSDTISGDYNLTWDNSNKRLGIGTNVPSEKLEVQGRVLVASSNPFELEPSDNILDVKGSINATVVIFVPRQSSQPFACDASKAGAIFYNTTDNKFYGCNSTNWVIIGG